MAGNDIFLRSVPSDSNPNDLRLYDPTQADAGGASPAVFSGTAAIIFDQSAGLNDSDVYAGTGSIIFGQQGNLLAGVVLAGTVGVTFGQTGALLSSAAIAGTSPVVFGQTGNLSSEAILAATTPVLFGQTGALDGQAVFAGTDLITFGQTGAFVAGVGASNETTTSAGSYNMYRGPDEPKRKLRKIKYIGPSEKVQTFYIEATKSNEWIPAVIRRPSVLEAIERNGLKTRQWKGAKLRRQIMADDEWLMMA